MLRITLNFHTSHVIGLGKNNIQTKSESVLAMFERFIEL